MKYPLFGMILGFFFLLFFFFAVLSLVFTALARASGTQKERFLRLADETGSAAWVPAFGLAIALIIYGA